MIFVDADAFIGVSISTDPHYRKSTNLFNRLLNSNEALITSWDVVDETATKLAKFSSKQTASKFLYFIKKSNIEIKFIDIGLYKRVLNFFMKQTSKNVSVTDCANMVIAKNLGVTTFFSFDRHYKKNGFKLLE